ncbi:MAG TPA: glycosyltransferase [Opitutaceae bacterium]|jgi:rhamnosyltransferase subunit B
MPLRILLPAIGSSGDVNPVIGLGRALKARGHSVTVITNQLFCGQIRQAGLEFAQLGTREQAEAMMRDPRLWTLRGGFQCIVEGALLPYLGPLYEMIRERSDASTVVAATTLCLGARVAQEKLGIRTATLNMQPTVFRSVVDGGWFGPIHLGPRTPRFAKQAFYWFIDRAYVGRLVEPTFNAFRKTLGLPPVRDIFKTYFHSPQLVLGLFPNWFAPVQPDWPPNTHLTGFILHDDGGEAGTDAEAEAFLAEGPPPLLVTPGSAAMDRHRFFAETIRACAGIGARAMLVTNHPAQLPGRLPAGIRAFAYLPFSRIFPRCAAVAYHGGVGTLAQTVRAGVPHLIIPNAHDQPDNARRIERLGLGVRVDPLRYKGIRAARALESALHSDPIRRRCAEFAPQVDGNASLDRACTLIEGLAEADAVRS